VLSSRVSPRARSRARQRNEEKYHASDGGCTGGPKGGGRYNACPFNNPDYPDRDAYRNGQGGYGGNGAYDGGPNH
jgi:hypothetical protein